MRATITVVTTVLAITRNRHDRKKHEAREQETASALFAFDPTHSTVTATLLFADRARLQDAQSGSMKKYNKCLVSSLAAIGSLAFILSTACAEDGQEGGSDVQGIESLDIDVVMTPTNAAPVGSSAEATLEAEDDHGTSVSKLKIEEQGLPAGTYSVSVTLKSNGSVVSLGSFSVPAGANEIEFGDDEGTPFPANFNPLDIATVTLLDANNVVLFAADFTNASTVTSMDRSASVQVAAGPSAPSAAGTATLMAHVIKGQTKGSLQLSVSGLTANTGLTVAANGATAKSTKSDKSGNLNLTLGPKGKTGTIAQGVNLFAVKSVTVKVRSGNLLLTASF
jgi:hypothetical protein